MAAKKGLQWILQEAKRLKRQYPNRFKTWKEYIAQATAIYHSKKGDSIRKKSKSKTKARAKTATRRKRKTSYIRQKSGLTTRVAKLMPVERKLRQMLAKDKQRSPHGYELVTAKRSVSGMIGMRLSDLKKSLKAERARLKHGYDLVRRKVAGVGAVDDSVIRDLVKHYEHVYGRLMVNHGRSETAAEKKKFRSMAAEIQRHLRELAKMANYNV